MQARRAVPQRGSLNGLTFTQQLSVLSCFFAGIDVKFFKPPKLPLKLSAGFDTRAVDCSASKGVYQMVMHVCSRPICLSPELRFFGIGFLMKAGRRETRRNSHYMVSSKRCGLMDCEGETVKPPSSF
ncbi:hypothetical protein BDW68DRAFT_153509 [Aspergillus falconensis]